MKIKSFFIGLAILIVLIGIIFAWMIKTGRINPKAFGNYATVQGKVMAEIGFQSFSHGFRPVGEASILVDSEEVAFSDHFGQFQVNIPVGTNHLIKVRPKGDFRNSPQITVKADYDDQIIRLANDALTLSPGYDMPTEQTQDHNYLPAQRRIITGEIKDKNTEQLIYRANISLEDTSGTESDGTMYTTSSISGYVFEREEELPFGNYIIDAPPGMYRLFIDAPGYNQELIEGINLQPYVNNSTDTNNFNLILTKNFSLIKNPGTSSGSIGGVVSFNQDETAISGAEIYYNGSYAISQDSGIFLIPQVPSSTGRLEIKYFRKDGQFLKEIFRPFTQQITVNTDKTTFVEGKLEPINPASINLTALDNNNLPLADKTVTIIGRNSDNVFNNISLAKQINDQGQVNFLGIPAGRYQLSVYDDKHMIDYEIPAELEELVLETGANPDKTITGISQNPDTPGLNPVQMTWGEGWPKPFEAGWHLISFPGYLPDPDPASVIENQIALNNLYRWDPYNLTYVKYEDFDPSSFGPIMPDEGYWIHFNEPTVLSIYSLPSFTPRYVILEKGWNIIGNAFFDQKIPGSETGPELSQMQVRKI
jgi:hypothetical protein